MRNTRVFNSLANFLRHSQGLWPLTTRQHNYKLLAAVAGCKPLAASGNLLKYTGDAAQAIIDDAIDPLGRYRMDENFRKKRLSRAEMIEQAKGTAEVARELYGRLLNMDTYIRAWAVEDSYRVWNDLGFLDSGQQYLLRLEALMKAASAKARRLPSKVPSRTGHRNRLLAETVESVGNRCAGKTKADVREIAAALLTCWGVDSPTDASKARKAIKRAK